MDQYNLNEGLVISLILDLNCSLMDSWEGSSHDTPFFEFISRGDSFLVEFLGIVVFGQDYDEREHFVETDTYEDFKPYLIRKAKSVVQSLGELQFNN